MTACWPAVSPWRRRYPTASGTLERPSSWPKGKQVRPHAKSGHGDGLRRLLEKPVLTGSSGRDRWMGCQGAGHVEALGRSPAGSGDLMGFRGAGKWVWLGTSATHSRVFQNFRPQSPTLGDGAPADYAGSSFPRFPPPVLRRRHDAPHRCLNHVRCHKHPSPRAALVPRRSWALSRPASPAFPPTRTCSLLTATGCRWKPLPPPIGWRRSIPPPARSATGIRSGPPTCTPPENWSTFSTGRWICSSARDTRSSSDPALAGVCPGCRQSGCPRSRASWPVPGSRARRQRRTGCRR
jgi:hypothetical protein